MTYVFFFHFNVLDLFLQYVSCGLINLENQVFCCQRIIALNICCGCTIVMSYNGMPCHIGCVRLPVSTASRTYKLSEETDVTPFCTCRFHSTGLCKYKAEERTYRRKTCCRYGLTVRKYWAQSHVFRTYRWVSRGLFSRVRRYGLLYLRTVEYDQCLLVFFSP